MQFQNLTTSLNGNMLTIKISRPKSLNALNINTINEIKEAFTNVLANDNIGGIILTGEGEKAFVAGADITEIANMDESSASQLSQNGHDVFNMIESCRKPVIAAINGFALGGGCELAMACHMRVASENARFGQPEVNLGLIPGYGGTQRLPQLIGKGKALELLMTGDMIGAEEAHQLGLVNHVVEQTELLSFSEKLMKKILSKAPLANAVIIDCVNDYYDSKDGFRSEIEGFAACTKTEDFKEGTSAFLEKRKPEFKGE